MTRSIWSRSRIRPACGVESRTSIRPEARGSNAAGSNARHSRSGSSSEGSIAAKPGWSNGTSISLPPVRWTSSRRDVTARHVDALLAPGRVAAGRAVVPPRDRALEPVLDDLGALGLQLGPLRGREAPPAGQQ